MYAKFAFLWKFILLALVSILGVTGCGVFQVGAGIVPSATTDPVGQLTVVGPEAARDVALAYIRTYHPGTGPSEDAFWFEEMEDTGGLVGSSAIKYRYESWVVRVTYPVVAPEATLYTVTVEGSDPGFYWQGLVDAYGQVAETAFTLGNPIPTMAPPTVTPIPAMTATPVPTEVPSATPTATATNTATPAPTWTPIVDPCNAAEFVADVTIQDGTTFISGAKFKKVWRLKNVGVCTWTGDYDLVFVDGRLMGGREVQGLPGQVRPGESIDISADFEAPKDPGDYKGFWMLRDQNGVLFGLGDRADKSFWVSINVVDFDVGSYEVDFALDYCAATWRSDSGRLPCPGFVTSTDGFVRLLANADLENRRENEPTLWVHPYEERYGWIEGTYPSYKVGEGDHFKAWVGCLEGYDRCSLKFYLDYEGENGRIYRLGEWVETYDGQVTKIDIDLADLEGDKVRLILGVEANTKNVEDAQGFWFVPVIE